MIEKGTHINAVCGSCLDYHKPKTVVDVYLDQGHAEDVLTVIHRCPCGKLSKTSYKHFSSGPVASENGYQVGEG